MNQGLRDTQLTWGETIFNPTPLHSTLGNLATQGPAVTPSKMPQPTTGVSPLMDNTPTAGPSNTPRHRDE